MTQTILPDRSPFRSLLMGGFESSAHRRGDGTRLDMIAATRHDVRAELDYALLAQHGLRCARDALRWHLIEAKPGRYDWSSLLPMLDAARRSGVQVVWDLCHYGLPDWADIEAADFADRFAAYAGAAARLLRDRDDAMPPVFCVINEISFWAWAADHGHMLPRPAGGGPALKRILVRAAIAAIDAIRDVEPRARFLQPEPLIHVVPADPADPAAVAAASAYREIQFETFDMLSGRAAPELGGTPAHLDLPGANFYSDNQWVHGGPTVPFGARDYRPLTDLLGDLHARTGRPVVISETGAEGDSGAAWLRHVGAEVLSAMGDGVPVAGLCLYPVADYPGWANGRHCRCGLIKLGADWWDREIDPSVGHVLRQQLAIFADADRAPRDLARAA